MMASAKGRLNQYIAYWISLLTIFATLRYLPVSHLRYTTPFSLCILSLLHLTVIYYVIWPDNPVAAAFYPRDFSAVVHALDKTPIGVLSVVILYVAVFYVSVLPTVLCKIIAPTVPLKFISDVSLILSGSLIYIYLLLTVSLIIIHGLFANTPGAALDTLLIPLIGALYCLLYGIVSYRLYKQNACTYPARLACSGVVIILLILYSIRAIYATSHIYGNGPIPNVSYGDMLLSSKLQYLIEKSKRGDLAIVYSPYEANEYRVFRVVGLPNEVVEMQCGQIYIDGVPVERVRLDDYEVKGKRSLPSVLGAYIDENPTDIRKVPQFRESMPNNISYNVIQEHVCDTISNMVSTKIPIDAYFLLSDNRDIGRDSRATNPGLLERKNILSHIYARIWPLRAPL